MSEKVAAVVNTDVRGVSPQEMGLSVEAMVGKAEARLCAVNEAGESWPMGFGLWAPDGGGPQIEALSVVQCAQLVTIPN